MNTVAPDGMRIKITDGCLQFGGISMSGTQVNMAYTLIDTPYVNQPLLECVKFLQNGELLSAQIEARKNEADSLYYHQDETSIVPLFWIKESSAFDCQGNFWGNVRQDGIFVTEMQFQESDLPIPRFYYDKVDEGVFRLDVTKFF